MGISWDATELIDGLSNVKQRALKAILALADIGAKKVENYAKEHRPWTDRTGDARRRLTAKSYREENLLIIELAHGVPYGVYLELANAGKYAIIEEALRTVGTREILPAFNLLLERVK